MKVVAHGGQKSAALQLRLLRIFGAILQVTNRRGFGRLVEMLGKRVFSPNNYVYLSFDDGARLKVPLNDYYWARLTLPGMVYEPELHFVLRRALTPQSVFIDCGANIGYWSVYATQVIKDANHIFAIEAGAETFGRLTENQRLNGNGFVAVNAAIDASSNERRSFAFKVGRHAGSHLLNESEAPKDWRIEQVPTVSIDEIVANIVDLSRLQVIVKLDVEGAEIAALNGARATLQHDPLVIYEDHGADRACKTSRFIMHDLRMQVCAIEGTELRRMSTIEEIEELKTDKHKGYNLVACAHGSPWVDRIRDMH